MARCLLYCLAERRHLSMSNKLKIESATLDNSFEIYVEVPGYSREEISVELTYKEFDLLGFGIPVEFPCILVGAENNNRGKREVIIRLDYGKKADYKNITSAVNNGLLTIYVPRSKKYTSQTIPVM